MPHTNSVDGSIAGAVVQATTITGGVHIQASRPETPRQLPARPRVFIGRAAELAELSVAVAGEAPVVILTGPAGVGKTILARRWAHDVVDRFPDGQLYVDLQGFSEAAAVDPGEALGHLLRALGLPAEQVPATVAEQSARYRSLTTGRALLIVLDNAFSVAQVRTLLPGAGPSLVLVTSRQRLAGLVADGGHPVEVRPWTVEDSVALLEKTLGSERVEGERSQAVALAEVCGGLPIALSVVSARLVNRPRFPLARLVAELEEETNRLRGLRTADGVSVLSSLDLSYRCLGRPAQTVYRRLAALPGREYGPGPIANLAEHGDEAIDELVSANLLEEVAADRFRQHDLLFLHARRCFEAEESQVSHSRRVCLEWYLASATAAERILTPYRRRPLTYESAGRLVAVPAFASRDEALQWLDDERPSLLAAGRDALAYGWNDLAWHLTDVLWPLLLYKKHYRDRIVIDETGVTAARRWGQPWAEAEMRKRLGDAYAQSGRHAEAEHQLRLAADGYRAAGDPDGGLEADARMASLYRDTGRQPEAIRIYRRVIEASADQRRTGLLLISLGALLAEAGEPDEAIDHLRKACAVFGDLADVDPYNGLRAEIALARAHLAHGDLAEAAVTASRGAAGMRDLGSRFEEAQAVEVLARVAQARGEVTESRRHRQYALEIYDALGSPRAAVLRDPGVIDRDGGEPERHARLAP
ncbi:tetratricopeptide repeat protein [Paractinoplanes rishiriensis]|uniref:NTPase n=1 Tax=Paractinoplanes rishiriensis TaxID=1050105 RepID=A0A919KB97_9ACTN|nr:tetratricopeptide repeat protein [Actinoplanes rishiriensis]GIF00122.1 NTPase [Actinoplanes rishiriensis]